MKSSKEKVIMFPKWKEVLEKESLHAMQEKRYAEALEKLDQLLSHDIETHEILTGKIICLMELGKYDEAESICLNLIELHNDHYYEYIHIYLTLLFQTSQYDTLIEQLDTVFAEGDVPEPVKGQLWQLYEISEQLSQDRNEEKAAFQVSELETAITEKDPVLQWRAISKARSLPILPHLDLIKEMLIDKEIHPVVKTAATQWLQTQNIDEELRIHKLGCDAVFNPSELKEIKGHHITNQIVIRLRETEQQSPSLYELLEKLLSRYLYVRYPVMPENEELGAVTEALKWLAEAYLNMESDNIPLETIDETTKKFIKEIQYCEAEYFSVLLD